MTISVIIPTLNEAEQIASLLDHMHNIDATLELIVSDCNSQDDTVSLAKGRAIVVEAPRGRANQMNTGAKAASGDILWFVHADCRPHSHSADAIRDALSDSNTVGGAFEWVLDGESLFFRMVEQTAKFKNRFFKLFYGDMGIFVKKTVFQTMSGYAEIPLMEDMDFCRRLKKQGRIVILPDKIKTSARRWEEEGRLYNLFRNWVLQILFFCGVSPVTLERWYRFK